MARAVLTRDPSEIDAYAVALAAIGIEVVAMPITRAAPARDPDALGRALTGDFAAIVIASARAARELARVAGSHALPEIWAVGPATRQALELAGLPARHPDHVRDGTELAAALIASRTLAGKRVLVPRAEDGRVEALELLRNAGAEVVDVIAYRTIATPADDPEIARGVSLLRAGEVAACVVFAPSQVAALAALVPIAQLAVPFCAIGETTAAALRAAGVVEVAVADSPTPAGIAQAVRAVYPPGR